MEKNPEIQFRSPEEIKCYQEERLAQTLTYLQAHSKFDQRMFEEHHIDINQIKKIEDLQQIPVTTKTDLQLHNDGFICVDKEQIIDYVTTSRHTGRSGDFRSHFRGPGPFILQRVPVFHHHRMQ